MTYTLIKNFPPLKRGQEIQSHSRYNVGIVIGIPRHPNAFWTQDFVDKHTEIFQKK